MNDNKCGYGFDECKTVAEVSARKKQLSKMLHPDHGGDATLFQQATEAASKRLKQLTEGEQTQEAQQVNVVDALGRAFAQSLNTPEMRNAIGGAIMDVAQSALGGLFSNNK